MPRDDWNWEEEPPEFLSLAQLRQIEKELPSINPRYVEAAMRGYGCERSDVLPGFAKVSADLGEIARLCRSLARKLSHPSGHVVRALRPLQRTHMRETAQMLEPLAKQIEERRAQLPSSGAPTPSADDELFRSLREIVSEAGEEVSDNRSGALVTLASIVLDRTPEEARDWVRYRINAGK
jgi:hypothetical protein